MAHCTPYQSHHPERRDGDYGADVPFTANAYVHPRLEHTLPYPPGPPGPGTRLITGRPFPAPLAPPINIEVPCPEPKCCPRITNCCEVPCPEPKCCPRITNCYEKSPIITPRSDCCLKSSTTCTVKKVNDCCLDATCMLCCEKPSDQLCCKPTCNTACKSACCTAVQETSGFCCPTEKCCKKLSCCNYAPPSLGIQENQSTTETHRQDQKIGESHTFCACLPSELPVIYECDEAAEDFNSENCENVKYPCKQEANTENEICIFCNESSHGTRFN